MATCTDCTRTVPAVPGLVACCVAHVDQDGAPCLDGRRECPDEPCTTWGLIYAATMAQMTLKEWQLSNLEHLGLW